MMAGFRENPPKSLAGSTLAIVKDYQNQIEKNLVTGEEKAIDLPKADVLQFFTEDGSKISARPSGTEPKIKFYFGVKEDLASKADYDSVNEKLDNKLKAIITDLGI